MTSIILVLIASLLFWGFAAFRRSKISSTGSASWFSTNYKDVVAISLTGTAYSIIVIVLRLLPKTGPAIKNWSENDPLGSGVSMQGLFTFCLLFTVSYWVLMPYKHESVKKYVGWLCIILTILVLMFSFFFKGKDNPLYSESYTVLKGKPVQIEHFEKEKILFRTTKNILIEFSVDGKIATYRIKSGATGYPEYVAGQKVSYWDEDGSKVINIPPGFIDIYPEEAEEVEVSISRN